MTPTPTDAQLLTEKDIELANLQANFDEYIESSRELEEELDAEITKLQEKLNESSAANRSLIAQLNSVSPQIANLEGTIQTVTAQLSKSNELKLKAEQSSEDAEARSREIEMSFSRLKEQEAAATEELALTLGELEEVREDYACYMDRARSEIEELKADLAAAQQHAMSRDNQQTSTSTSTGTGKHNTATTSSNERNGEVAAAVSADSTSNGVVGDANKAIATTTTNNNSEEQMEYITSLEDELEDVTEQLIEAQAQLNELETQLEASLKDREDSEHMIIEMSEQLEELQSAPTSAENSEDERIRLSSQIARLQEESAALTEELELLNEELALTQEQIEPMELENKALKEKAVENDKKIHHLTEQVDLLEGRLKDQGLDNLEPSLTWSKSNIQANENDEEHKSNAESFSNNLDDDVTNIISSNDVTLLSDKLRKLAKKTKSQQSYNAQLLSKILQLQGNIQVCCRIRPMSNKERENEEQGIVEPLSETEIGCFDHRSRSWKSFAFDRVWGPDEGQSSVFQDVEPLALSVVDGYNSCIFAYGQTGSGKTYTMEGCNGDGISHRTLVKVFSLLHQKAISSDSSHPFSFAVKVGMLEIYNDEVYDLLSKNDTAVIASGKASSLDIRRSSAGYMEVPGLVKEDVSSPQDVANLLQRGNAKRSTSSTNMNEHSSRSHMVLHVEVHTAVNGHEQPIGNLYLVDLAGSERVRKSGVEGSELKEAQYINKSLSALGDVMGALDQKASHVPFRNSKLTYLLQDSLGGNSRTMMVVTVCPGSRSSDESICTLQFATRVRRINLGSAQKNVSNKNLEESLKNATKEMKQLESAKLRTEEQLLALRRDHQRIQDRLQASQELRSQNKDESRTIAVLRKTNEDLSARLLKEKGSKQEKLFDLENCQQELRRIQKQLLAATRDRDSLSKRLIDNESDMKELKQRLREAKDSASAANIRARKSTIIKPPLGANGASSRSTTRGMSSANVRGRSSTSSVRSTSSVTSTSGSAEAAEIREEIRQLIETHDPQKVDKLDDLMARFRGKEARLLEKMKARYEETKTDSSSSSSKSPTPRSSDVISPSDSVKKRSELAMARHAERMRKIRSSTK
uniref:Kinesin motor domain-containing protein n=1 Tax=Leptocylindrus danicus TaxID=163516 RepID=A0A7S2K311_9STRA